MRVTALSPSVPPDRGIEPTPFHLDFEVPPPSGHAQSHPFVRSPLPQTRLPLRPPTRPLRSCGAPSPECWPCLVAGLQDGPQQPRMMEARAAGPPGGTRGFRRGREGPHGLVSGLSRRDRGPGRGPSGRALRFELENLSVHTVLPGMAGALQERAQVGGRASPPRFWLKVLGVRELGASLPERAAWGAKLLDRLCRTPHLEAGMSP